MNEKASFKIEDVLKFKKQLLYWANQFEICLCLDNNQVKNQYNLLDFTIAVDAIKSISLSSNDSNHFNKLEAFKNQATNTIFGYLSYDLKNDVEQLNSKNLDELNLPELYFFEPRYLIEIKEDVCTINRSTLEASWILDQIKSMSIEDGNTSINIPWKTRVSKEDYIRNVEKIQNDIFEGTVYELNYCRELYAENCDFNPIASFLKINAKTKAPFTAFFKLGDIYALSFSPERFMQVNNDKLLSQPIKGTIKKGSSEEENKQLASQLLNDEKERAENVMIVDLVRNDFAKSAEVGSVKVDELFGIYEFQNIIQMISTVSAQKRKDVSSIQAVKNAFPMGSMTGAPKVKSMELIEKYESSKRGLYSGAIGYIAKDDNLDFNVVIRTLIFNAKSKYLSFQVGGAITYDSIPEKEWDETETKANSILKYLSK